MNWMPIETGLLRARHWSWTVGAFVAIVAVGVIDYLTDPRITLSVFYLLPVAVAAWLAGSTVAVAASVLAAVARLCADYASNRLDSSLFVYAWNFCARLLFLMLVALLLARLHQMLIRERTLSRTDALTGLLNARVFREVADAEIARAQRYAQPLSLAFIDVDDFKGVNDSRGHSTGDRLLRRIADVVQGNLRGVDVVARYGGEELVILLPVADPDAARVAVDKLREKVGAAMTAGNWPVTLSVGVVTYQPGGPPVTLDAMLDCANRLMYDVKSGDKNGARFDTCGR